jgi:hypothetical protein
MEKPFKVNLLLEIIKRLIKRGKKIDQFISWGCVKSQKK